MQVTPANLRPVGIPTSYVPFRNANMLAAAVSWAEVINAEGVFIGAVEDDTPGYPDCRRSFYEAFGEVVREGTRPETRIRIITPLLDLTKTAIVRRGVELSAPFHLTWSCYQREDVACGVLSRMPANLITAPEWRLNGTVRIQHVQTDSGDVQQSSAGCAPGDHCRTGA
jgi:7-cyano-7-deazaguanine synthase